MLEVGSWSLGALLDSSEAGCGKALLVLECRLQRCMVGALVVAGYGLSLDLISLPQRIARLQRHEVLHAVAELKDCPALP